MSGLERRVVLNEPYKGLIWLFQMSPAKYCRDTEPHLQDDMARNVIAAQNADLIHGVHAQHHHICLNQPFLPKSCW